MTTTKSFVIGIAAVLLAAVLILVQLFGEVILMIRLGALASFLMVAALLGAGTGAGLMAWWAGITFHRKEPMQ